LQTKRRLSSTPSRTALHTRSGPAEKADIVQSWTIGPYLTDRKTDLCRLLKNHCSKAGSIFDTYLLKDMIKVISHSSFCQIETLRNLLVAETR
jgi:hypothetical protein